VTITATGPIVWTNDTEDSERASGGISRYGVYLDQRRSWFDFGDMSAAEFAAVCWQIATSPIMAPGYVQHLPEIQSIGTARNDDGALAMLLSIALPHHALANRTALTRHQAQDWAYEPVWGGTGTRRREPEHRTAPIVLATASILLPVPDTQLLAPPSTDPGSGLTKWAKGAVTNLAIYTSTHAAPLIEALLGEVAR
jgi:hypothetical protein